MTTVTSTTDIERPIEDVFEVLTNVENTGRWFPAQVEEHWSSPPPLGVGSTRHAVMTVMGRRTENDAVVEEYEPPHRAVMRGTSASAPFVTTLTFERKHDGTRVHATTEIAFRGAQRAFGPLFANWFRRAWDRGLQNLKRLMESGEL
jgi:uncharacterized protein YndB with AHSA1/START domain